MKQRAPALRSSAAFAWSAARANASTITSGDPSRLLGGVLGVADAVAILVCSLVVTALCDGVRPVPPDAMPMTALAIVLTLNILCIAGVYGRHRLERARRTIARVGLAWSMVFTSVLTFNWIVTQQDSASLTWWFAWYCAVLVSLTSLRMMAAVQVQHWQRRGRLTRTVAVIDLSGDGAGLARRLLQHDAADVRLAGVFSDASLGRRNCRIDDLVALSRLFRIDEILIAVSAHGDPDLGDVLRRVGRIPSNVRLCPTLPDLGATPVRGAGLFFDTPMLMVHQRPLAGWSSLIKRVEDLVLGSLMTIALAPVMLVIALLIKIDSNGPALFRQQRMGFNNRPIVVLKFRTMTHRAEPEDNVPQAQRNDPRVTRLGRILRRTSLDELPQLFNVLRGKMSLVGPRPHALSHDRQYAMLIGDYLARNRVLPGITGWAQVSGFRGETDTIDKMQRRVEYDLAYIANWSIWFDLKIIFLTALSVVSSRNAY